VLNNA